MRLRAAACLLADIGWRAHPDYRGEQSLNIISNAAFVGIDHPGRAYLALAIYYRHAGLSEDELGAGAARDRAAALARGRACARRRVSRRLSHFGRGGGRAAEDADAARGRQAELVLPPDLADLRGARLESRLRQFATLGGLSYAIEVGRG